MNDSPGWASPGSSPADGERPDAAAPAGQDGPPAGAPDGTGSGPAASGPRWSKEQPPPGRWSAPGPGGAAPGPVPGGPAPQPQAPQGWGNPYPGGPAPQGGGWGTGPAWGRPPAAKPGVIPLRPLAVGEILDGAVTTMREHWRTVLGIALAFAVVTQLAITLVQGFLFETTTTSTADPEDLGAIADDIGANLAASGIAQVITLIGTIIATATLTMVVSRAVLGQSSEIGPVWREARPQLLKLTGLTLLLALMGVAVLAVGIVPGVLASNVPLAVAGGIIAFFVMVWLWVRYSLASPALMLEKQTVVKALGRSAKLVRGSWWRVFGISLLVQVLTSIVAGIIILPFTLVAMAVTGGGMDGIVNGTAGFGWGFLIISAIGAVIALTITMPINAGVTVLLYIDQRIRREALDLELARAAGLRDYGGPAPSGTGG
ncbi:glycerophosphoryl diester phosphodiesterase membrane domain-containing protein [Streptomyces bambusae]|uniref:glycerophosphoryl diester phosphodiesterase membrane domain-containing protein n=1 Tax=Streptomyces bambusae TaxID=1550616 RepID=UPI001D000127|nr:glycerophosphoryl diester phosphodiesterase membrane domain-containing protein [Streptomyces bambusae]MCB5169433.1 glycerophosphoryl diester phosphodiesterase membrane domain-containing protein [Streptomyces bambusae]